MIWKHSKDHPSDSQKKIGKVFGVERSTVSKICKAMNKTMAVDSSRYLSTSSRPVSPHEIPASDLPHVALARPSPPTPFYSSGSLRSSVSSVSSSADQYPHVTYALADWVRSHYSSFTGSPSDEILRDQAIRIASSVPSADSAAFVPDAAWLHNFKISHPDCFFSPSPSPMPLVTALHSLEDDSSMHTRSHTRARSRAYTTSISSSSSNHSYVSNPNVSAIFDSHVNDRSYDESSYDDDEDEDRNYQLQSVFHLDMSSANPQSSATLLDEQFYGMPSTTPGGFAAPDVSDLSLQQYTGYSTSVNSTSYSPQSSPELLTPVSGSFPALELQPGVLHDQSCTSQGCSCYGGLDVSMLGIGEMAMYPQNVGNIEYVGVEDSMLSFAS